MSECKTCAGPVSKYSKTGYCRICWNTSPEKRAKTSAAAKRNWATNPELRARYIAAGVRNLNLPGVRERANATIKERKCWEIASQHITPEVVEKATKRSLETRLAHIPRELRGEYKRLTRGKKLLASEAAEIVQQQHERDMARFRQSITQGKRRAQV